MKKNLQIKFNEFIKKLETLPVYEFDDDKYIKVDEFMEIWRGVVNV